jgi:osmotically-inducible protein OsmY
MKLATIRSVRSASLKPRLSPAALFALTCLFSGCTTMPDYASAQQVDSTALRDRVVDRLAHDPELQLLIPLNVQTRHQIVYLYGTVSADWQRELAQSVAAQTQGVSEVANLIEVAE